LVFVASLCAIAMSQAVANSGLSEAQISNQNTGLIVGSGNFKKLTTYFRPFFVHKNTKNSIKITQDSRR
jgi:3-oxoacyl-(acyl-carrier-protein) synthase